jgi:malonyl-CoA O-methyltransferase
MTDPPILSPRAAYARWAASYPPHAHNPLMQAEERAMLALLPARLGGAAVLDAGCGSGRYLAHARSRGASRLLGIDLSIEMLRRAPPAGLIQASLSQLPLRDRWADLTICGLTIGHLDDLAAPLAELRRVTRPGGQILISDFHPVGAALGWRREFRADGRRYAVRHTAHLHSAWQRACAGLGLQIAALVEPFLDPADIPPGASFDQLAMQVPVVYLLERQR